MNDLLTLPLLEAGVLIAKMTVIIVWGVVMIGFTLRIIIGSIMAELLDPHEES